MSAKDAEDGGPLKVQLEYLIARFEVLRQRVGSLAMPRDTNPPDLAGLRVKVDELSKTSGDVKNLSDRFRQAEDRMDRLQGDLKGLRDQIVAKGKRESLAARLAATAAASPKVDPPASPAPTPPSTDLAPTDSAMAQGIALFKKGQYQQAEAIFRNLRTTRQQDARSWYYSALTNGFATGQWDGETRYFVIQGADRERAGLPPAAEIDSAFADLSPASGKDWLASYRAQPVKR